MSHFFSAVPLTLIAKRRLAPESSWLPLRCGPMGGHKRHNPRDTGVAWRGIGKIGTSRYMR